MSKTIKAEIPSLLTDAQANAKAQWALIEKQEQLTAAKTAIHKNPVTTADIVSAVKALVRVLEMNQ